MQPWYVGNPAGRYPTSAARPSARARVNASPLLTCGGSRIEQAEPAAGGGDVLVPATGEVDQQHGVGAELLRDLASAAERMRGLDGRDDAFGPAQQLERLHRRRVRHGAIDRTSAVVQECVLRPDAGIIQPGGDGVRVERLSVLVLQHI